MVILPRTLYMIWHLPVYLVLRHFKSMEAILIPFIWGNSRHKLFWNKLKNPTDLARMALPGFNTYYLATQIATHIDKIDRDRFLIFLCPNWSHSTIDPIVALTGGVRGAERVGDANPCFTNSDGYGILYRTSSKHHKYMTLLLCGIIQLSQNST